MNETPADPSANRRYVLQQLRQRLESYKLRHRMCETQYDRHRREVLEREREEARRLQQLLGEVARKNQQRQGRNGMKIPVAMGDQQSPQATSDDLQVRIVVYYLPQLAVNDETYTTAREFGPWDPTLLISYYYQCPCSPGIPPVLLLA